MHKHKFYLDFAHYRAGLFRGYWINNMDDNEPSPYEASSSAYIANDCYLQTHFDTFDSNSW